MAFKILFIEVALFDFLLLWMAVQRIHGCCVRRVFAVVKSLILVSSLDLCDIPRQLRWPRCPCSSPVPGRVENVGSSSSNFLEVLTKSLFQNFCRSSSVGLSETVPRECSFPSLALEASCGLSCSSWLALHFPKRKPSLWQNLQTSMVTCLTP